MIFPEYLETLTTSLHYLQFRAKQTNMDFSHKREKGRSNRSALLVNLL